ncbi:hypothetical protein FRX31_028412, partial [Thalictrum thalictroides]
MVHNIEVNMQNVIVSGLGHGHEYEFTCSWLGIMAPDFICGFLLLSKMLINGANSADVSGSLSKQKTIDISQIPVPSENYLGRSSLDVSDVAYCTIIFSI